MLALKMEGARSGVLNWLPYRDAYPNLGPVLFPALITRRREDQPSLTSALHPATLFKRLRDMLN
jgi:hypothetical protein